MSSPARKQQIDVIDITDDGPSCTPKYPIIKKQLNLMRTPPQIIKTINTSIIPELTPTVFAGAPNSATTDVTAGNDDNTNIEKKCENPDCSAPTLISLVPQQRSTPQLIHDPMVVPEPILINGYTTVFEVGGIMAKVNELNTIRGADGKLRYMSPKPIYRVVPKSHAHIVNYVIIDAEGETLRKIKQNDSATIKKLLESQKNSAEQLLEKLIGTKQNVADVQTVGSSTSPQYNKKSNSKNTLSNNRKICNNNSSTSSTTSTTNLQTRLTSTLKTVVPPNSNSNSVNNKGMPLPIPSLPTSGPIKTVTPVISSVSSRVSLPVSASGSTMSSTLTTSGTETVAATASIQKMQSELMELRQTVKLLTEQKRLSSNGVPDEKDPKKRKIS